MLLALSDSGSEVTSGADRFFALLSFLSFCLKLTFGDGERACAPKSVSCLNFGIGYSFGTYSLKVNKMVVVYFAIIADSLSGYRSVIVAALLLDSICTGIKVIPVLVGFSLYDLKLSDLTTGMVESDTSGSTYHRQTSGG